MGDTLPHLPSKGDVSQLLHEVATALRPGGQFLRAAPGPRGLHIVHAAKPAG
ncbi:hypothetical protein ABT187_14395 [Streptomyces sp. NPDC001817]|uniref:hypothetical protein n=1 Tax=Streptomyces sp. NPDC001817 TaxID=3154398 RepID=UPI00332C6E92